MANGPRGRFNDIVSHIVTGMALEGNSTMTTITMLRELSLRAEFLAALRTKAPCLRLVHISYLNLVDILRALLRECNNSNDFKSILEVFSLARLFGMSTNGTTLTVLHSLSTHEAWINRKFWIYCTDELVLRDIRRWDDIHSKYREIINLKDAAVYAMFVIIRIQIIAFSSMCMLNISPNVIGSYLEAVTTKYGLANIGIDISQTLHKGFLNWLLELSVSQLKSSRSHNDSTITEILEHAVQKQQHADSHHSPSYVSKSHLSVSNRMNPIPVYDSAHAKVVEIGYSYCIELIFLIVENYQNEYNDISPVSYRVENMCICGSPCGNWQALGVFEITSTTNTVNVFSPKSAAPVQFANPNEDDDNESLQESARLTKLSELGINTDKDTLQTQNKLLIPSIVCEKCYRQLFANLTELNLYLFEVGRCTLHTALPEKPTSFLSAFYGKKSSLCDFQGTTGYTVDRRMLDLYYNVIHNISYTSGGHNTDITSNNGSNVIMHSSPSHRSLGDVEDVDDEGPGGGAIGGGLPASGLDDPDARITIRKMSVHGATRGGSMRRRESTESHNSDEQSTTSASSDATIAKLQKTALRKFVTLMQSGIDVIKITNNPITRHISRTMFIDHTSSFLCWLPPGRAQLTPDPRSQISILTISSIKIGTGKYENCLNIVSDLKTLLIRIADTDLFQTILEGFILIAEKNRTSRSKGHGVGVATSVSR